MKRFLFALPLLALLGGLALSAEPPRIGIPPDEKTPLKEFQSVAADAGPDWGVAIVNAPDAWKVTKGKGVKVAVLDTGAALNHPDLKDAYKEAKDFTNSKTGTSDVQGHGTHVAGTIGARGPLKGVAPECTLYGGKVLDDSGSGGVDEIAAGIRHAAKVWEVDVINMSLGGPSPDDWIPPAVEEAVKAGVIVVCAAGNDGPRENSEGYPGGYKLCISVAACDKSRNIASFSSRGPNVFITGPGVDIRSTWPGGQYATISGTSMATPHIAGLAALWIAAHPEVKKVDRPAAFRLALQGSTNFTDRNSARGYGLADAAKVIGTKLPPVIPPVDPEKPGKVYRIDLGKLAAEGYTGVEFTIGGVPLPKVIPGPSADPVPAVPVPPVPKSPQSFGVSNFADPQAFGQQAWGCPPNGIPGTIATCQQQPPQFMPQACPAGGCDQQQSRPRLFPRLFR